MFQRLIQLCFTATLASIILTSTVFAQGLDTKASKEDWEEINFDFNSSVLVDGFPALLQLAELLQRNPGYRVRIEGNTDRVGGDSYNERLGLARANTVRDYLIKNGAGANQVTAASRGRTNPRVPAERGIQSATDEARWMSRRVVLFVTDAQGNTVSSLGAKEAINAMGRAGANGANGQNADPAAIQAAQAAAQAAQAAATQSAQAARAAQQTADQVAAQNRQLQDQIAKDAATLQQIQQNSQQAVQAARDAAAAAAANKPPSASEVAKATLDEHERRYPKFQILAANIGSTNNVDVTFTGKGRYFAPFGNHYAWQGEGEYYYARGRREGQGDFGLVDRINRFQAGMFASFKHVNMTGDQTGGTLGQASINLDYLFKWGKIGGYGTKAFMDDAIVNRVNALSAAGGILNNIYLERYLRVVDQVGANVTGPTFGKNYFEGNVGYLRATTVGDRFGGTLRLIFPITEKIAFTAEGGINETLIGRGNNGRAVFGVMFGNRIHPNEMLNFAHATPMQIARVRYEVLTRRVRVGNDAPIADAGPNQTLTAAGTVTLNGSNSYDPDGDPLTYQWIQESGAGVTLNNATSAIATFAAAAGQTYGFRLTVKDSGGAQGTARVTVGVNGAAPVIGSFTATPATINVGQQTTLAWDVTGSDIVSISGIGSVAPNGSQLVSPTATTTYILTAVRGLQTSTKSVTVTVNSGAPVIVSFTATPSNINLAGTSTLAWDVTGADVVTLTGLGNVVAKGSTVVSPTVNTTYILAATKGAQTVTRSVTVTVNSVAPVITSFTFTRDSEIAGSIVTLKCSASNASSIELAGATFNTNTVTTTVQPFVNTNYLCVANGPTGLTAQQQVTVNVIPGGLGR